MTEDARPLSREQIMSLPDAHLEARVRYLPLPPSRRPRSGSLILGAEQKQCFRSEVWDLNAVADRSCEQDEPLNLRMLDGEAQRLPTIIRPPQDHRRVLRLAHVAKERRINERPRERDTYGECEHADEGEDAAADPRTYHSKYPDYGHEVNSSGRSRSDEAPPKKKQRCHALCLTARLDVQHRRDIPALNVILGGWWCPVAGADSGGGG